MTDRRQNTQLTTTGRGNGAPPVAVSRSGFGGSTEIEMRRETAAIAVAERARAEVEVHYKMALHRPRSVSEARRRILDHCRRPRFAEVARYSVPRRKRVGDRWENVQIQGESIRFIETALQEYGNVLIRCPVTWEDENERRIEVAVIDLERNIKYDEEIVIRKVTEKRYLGKGEEAIGQRETSEGNIVYLVAATDQRVHEMQNAMKSKAIRTLGKRILPADIVEEAMEQVAATLRAEAADDPSAARKRMTDAFAGVGIYPRQLEEYLGHPLEQTTPAESEELRVLYASIKEGEATWTDIIEARREQRGEAAPAAGQEEQQAPPKKAEAKAAALLRKRAEARRKTSSAPPPAPAPRGEAKAPAAPASSEGQAEEEVDELGAEIDDLRAALEVVVGSPEQLPGIKKRIAALPPCDDKEALEELLAKAEVAIEEENS